MKLKRTLMGCLLLTLVNSAFGTAQESTDRNRIRNVLLIISDDLRANTVGAYGDQVCETPNIDRLTREGLVFDRAYCQAVWCAPSRISFMFGRYQGRGATNVGEHFKNNGFYSARVGKVFHMAVPKDIIAGTDGKDFPISWTERFNSQGNEAHTPGDYACLSLNVFSRELEGRQSSGMPERIFVSVAMDGDGRDQPDYKTASKTIELLNKHQDKPFFIAAGFVRPHYPMVAPKSYFDAYPHQEIVMPQRIENDLEDIPPLGRDEDINMNRYPENHPRMWSAYYASVSFMDTQLGRILQELDRLGLRETTAIVFTSDHGYHLGDHTFWGKFNLHEQVARVPLVIAAPGYEPGRTESFAELVDLFPTLADLAGLNVPAHLQGASLVPILKDHSATVKEGALSIHKGHGWRTDGWAYMRYEDGTEELYDMQADPDQFTNLAGQPSHAAERERMSASLDARLEEIGYRKLLKRQKKHHKKTPER